MTVVKSSRQVFSEFALIAWFMTGTDSQEVSARNFYSTSWDSPFHGDGDLEEGNSVPTNEHAL